MKLIKDFNENFVQFDSGYETRPQIVLLCEDDKHMAETFKAIVAPLQLGLENQLQTPVGLLSGGQRQALSLIMATLVKPDLLLLDEHTAALDPKTSAKIMDLTNQMTVYCFSS